jgi:PhnB protein
MAILNPSLSFAGNAREAMTAYQDIFGGELNLMTFADMGMTEHDGTPIDATRIMHGQLTTDQGFTLMGADQPPSMGEPKNGSVSLSGDEEELLTGYFNKLVEGGTVGEPLAKAPWGDSFGMATDKFGIDWMVNISGAAAPQG